MCSYLHHLHPSKRQEGDYLLRTRLRPHDCLWLLGTLLLRPVPPLPNLRVPKPPRPRIHRPLLSLLYRRGLLLRSCSHLSYNAEYENILNRFSDLDLIRGGRRVLL